MNGGAGENGVVTLELQRLQGSSVQVEKRRLDRGDGSVDANVAVELRVAGVDGEVSETDNSGSRGQ